MQPSEEYKRGIELARQQNRKGKLNSGTFLLHQVKPIKEVIDRLGIKSALDYGCGKGVQYTKDIGGGRTLEEYWGIKVDKYDPGWPEWEKEPTGEYDLIVSTHALGLVPIQDLEWVIPRIFSMARKAVYIALMTGGFTGKWKKARWRTENIPPPEWTAMNWLSLFRRHLPRDRPLEVHFVVRRKERAAHYIMQGPEGSVTSTPARVPT